MADRADVPEGFEPIDLGNGFDARFGPVYMHKDGGRLGFRVASHHLNPVGGCHGGAMATFADMQIAAVRPGLGTKAGHMPTISLSVDYLAPADEKPVSGTLVILGDGTYKENAADANGVMRSNVERRAEVEGPSPADYDRPDTIASLSRCARQV